MSKKHFKAVAKVLFTYRPAPSDKSAFKTWQNVVEGLAIEFYSCCPRFDRERFYAAAELNPTVAEVVQQDAA